MCLNKAEVQQTVRRTSRLERLVSLHLFSICHRTSFYSICFHSSPSRGKELKSLFELCVCTCTGALPQGGEKAPLILRWPLLPSDCDLLTNFLVFKPENTLVLTLTVAFRCSIVENGFVYHSHLTVCVLIFVTSICSFLFLSAPKPAAAFKPRPGRHSRVFMQAEPQRHTNTQTLEERSVRTQSQPS